ERLTRPEAGTAHVPESWHPGGDLFSFSVEKGLAFSLRLFSVRDRHDEPFDSVESRLPPASSFSPDGHWIAYQSGEPVAPARFKQSRVFVQHVPPNAGERYQIAGPIAYRPMWSRDGKELFYASGLGSKAEWSAIRVTPQPGFPFGRPTPVPTGGLEPTRAWQGI